jgi:hypothetical protein
MTKEVKKEAEIIEVKTLNHKSVSIIKTGNNNEMKFRIIRGTYEHELNAYTENLVDSLCNSLLPLKNYKETMQDDDDPPPIYFLLENLIEVAERQLEDIAYGIQKEIGHTQLYRVCHSSNGINKGTVLGLKIEERKVQP